VREEAAVREVRVMLRDSLTPPGVRPWMVAGTRLLGGIISKIHHGQEAVQPPA
jgi:hypothetical protein